MVSQKVILLVTSVVLLGCSSFDQSAKLSALPNPSSPVDVSVAFHSANDPLERVNRTFFAVDQGLFDHVLEPAWTGYNAVMPKRARRGIRLFSDNLQYPIRLTGNVLQGEWNNAGIETKRFLINSTVGVLGFSDPAMKRFQLSVPEEDIGQAMGKWGWVNSMYLHVPIVGASTPRDVIGAAGAVYVDPASWIYGCGAGLKFNSKSFDAELTRNLLDTEFDPYFLNKLVYSRIRSGEISNTSMRLAGEDTAQTQTLVGLRHGPADPKFSKRAEVIFAQPEGFRKRLPVSLWRQSQSAPMAFILPGLGGHRHSDQSLALAEQAYLEGYHVVCFSNNFNWEFIQASPKGYLPGFTTQDVKLIGQLQEAINQKLATFSTGKPALMGFSMGAWYALNIAVSKEPDFYSTVLAINPPMNLRKATATLDELFVRTARQPASKSMREAALMKLATIQESDWKGSCDMSFTDDEASYLIGLGYRLTLIQTIMSGLNIRPNSESYAKIGQLSWEDYYQGILVPNLSSSEVNEDDLRTASSLSGAKDQLRELENLTLVLTGNDFILSDTDLNWLKASIPQGRLIFTESGGHMGQLARPEVRQSIRDAIRIQVNKLQD